jgi:hypothetical protein
MTSFFAKFVLDRVRPMGHWVQLRYQQREGIWIAFPLRTLLQKVSFSSGTNTLICMVRRRSDFPKNPKKQWLFAPRWFGMDRRCPAGSWVKTGYSWV